MLLLSNVSNDLLIKIFTKLEIFMISTNSRVSRDYTNSRNSGNSGISLCVDIGLIG